MKTVKELRQLIAKKAVTVAEELDFSAVASKTLLASLWKAFEDFDRIKREMCDESALVEKFPFLKGNPEMLRMHVRIAREGELSSISLVLGIQYAITGEIYRRAQGNKINVNFGLLKLGHDLGDLENRDKALGHLVGILLSIPRKKGWFHVEAQEGWIDVIYVALAEQLGKLVKVDPASTLEWMMDNQFAVIYEAVEDRLTDEVRRLALRPREVSLGHPHNVTLAFESVPAPSVNARENLQRLAVIKLVKQLSGRYKKKGTPEILEEVVKFLEEPDETRDGTLREIRARFVKNVALKRGISQEQARKNVRNFENLAQKDEAIQHLADEISDLGGANDTINLNLRECPPANRATEEGDDLRNGG
jgi:hypothetical protein